DRTRERMHIGMAVFFCLVKALATGKDEIGYAQKFTFVIDEFCRRILKKRKFVHAVVHDERWLQMPRDRKCHGRIIPEHVILYVPLGDHCVQQFTLCVGSSRMTGPFRKMGHRDDHLFRRSPDFQSRLRDRLINRFLEEKYPLMICRGPAQEMLWALKYEIPA